MASFARRHRVEIVLLAILSAVFLGSIAMAKHAVKHPDAVTNATDEVDYYYDEPASDSSDDNSGTAADFTRTYPFVVIALVTILLAIVGYFLVQRDKDKKERDDELNKRISSALAGIEKANEKLEKASDKVDATINTLFDRDRENERDIADLRSAVSGLMKTCEARAKMCPGAAGIYCYERRIEDGGRRADNGYTRERKTDGDDTLQVDD